jgi:hypothetical protein
MVDSDFDSHISRRKMISYQIMRHLDLSTPKRLLYPYNLLTAHPVATSGNDGGNIEWKTCPLKGTGILVSDVKICGMKLRRQQRHKIPAQIP